MKRALKRITLLLFFTSPSWAGQVSYVKDENGNVTRIEALAKQELDERISYLKQKIDERKTSIAYYQSQIAQWNKDLDTYNLELSTLTEVNNPASAEVP